MLLIALLLAGVHQPQVDSTGREVGAAVGRLAAAVVGLPRLAKSSSPA